MCLHATSEASGRPPAEVPRSNINKKGSSLAITHTRGCDCPMARPLLIEFPGAIYRVTARGNAREAIYLDDEDRRHFLETYSEVASRFNWLCHSYCMMTNHYHWVMETPGGNLGRGMRQLNEACTRSASIIGMGEDRARLPGAVQGDSRDGRPPRSHNKASDRTRRQTTIRAQCPPIRH